MVYDALIESRFGEAVKKARGALEKKLYGDASNFAEEAKKLIESLPKPRNLPEKLEYLELRARAYKTLSEVYAIVPSLAADEEAQRKLEEDMAKKVEPSVSRLANAIGMSGDFDGVKGLVSLLDEIASKFIELSRT